MNSANGLSSGAGAWLLNCRRCAWLWASVLGAGAWLNRSQRAQTSIGNLRCNFKGSSPILRQEPSQPSSGVMAGGPRLLHWPATVAGPAESLRKGKRRLGTDRWGARSGARPGRRRERLGCGWLSSVFWRPGSSSLRRLLRRLRPVLALAWGSLAPGIAPASGPRAVKGRH